MMGIEISRNDMVEAYIALGSNIGDREANIKKAFDVLKEKMKIAKSSAFMKLNPCI